MTVEQGFEHDHEGIAYKHSKAITSCGSGDLDAMLEILSLLKATTRIVMHSDLIKDH
tara:strand:+ start:162 stop:332 length:171 start_codon:yes stop_codon:yes gene_type:complete